MNVDGAGLPFKKVLVTAYALLAKRAYFSVELAHKLLSKGFDQSEISACIDHLKSKGIFSDLERAERFIEAHKNRGYGAKVIKMKLAIKSGQIDVPIEDTRETLCALIKKRYLKLFLTDRKKVIRALLQRGFSYDLIQQAFKQIGPFNSETQQID